MTSYELCLCRWVRTVFVGLCGSGFISTVMAEPVAFQAPRFIDVNAVTLRDCVLRAFDHDPVIAQMVAQIGIGQALIDEAKSAWHPQLSLQSGLGGSSGNSSRQDNRYNDTRYGLTLTQLVYDFGKTQNTILQQQDIKQGYIYSLQQTLGDVASRTAKTYLLIKRYAALKRVAEQGVKSLQVVERIAKIRANSGLSSRSDYLQAQSRIASLQAQAEQFTTQRETAIAQLEVLTGVRAATFAEPPQALNGQTMHVAAIDYSAIAAVKKARVEAEAAAKAIEKNKAGYLPTIQLQAGRTRYQNSNDPYWDNQIYLNLDVPLYTGGAVSARIAQAVDAKRAADEGINTAKFDAMTRAATAQANYNGARSRYRVSVRQVGIAQHARSVYLDEYKLSRRSVNDLVTVEQDLHQSKLSLRNAEFDRWDAAVDYAAAVDRLVNVLNIHSFEPLEALPDR
ncbi:TolC family outer membrane protein [Pseudomonas sp. NPDC078700]|uniref:TolC family outer membrane protein n=1 Tax=Pseudomonas sp. NPDC078700 TaxID=3364424 RepID=UPI0037CC6841